MCEKELDLLPRRAWFARQKSERVGNVWDVNGEIGGSGDGGGCHDGAGAGFMHGLGSQG
jgi:hypothetical protein